MLLYIHIPFCDSKCHYCSFNSYINKTSLIKTYIQAICKQFIFEIERFDIKEKEIETVFIGGGTPSVIPAMEYKIFFDLINKYLKNDIEITIEANPNSANLDWIKDIKKLGVNRISFGVQSFDEEKLKYLGRSHSGKDAINAINNAKMAGFENISIDLIHGTKIDNKKLLENDLRIAFSTSINHISTYHLSIEKGTLFYKIKEQTKEDIDEQIWFYDEIKKRGFAQYEISNFGKYHSIHNLGYWSHKDYIGLGAGAVGFLKNKRFYHHETIEKYIKEPLFWKEEKLSEDNIKTEKIFLGLRSNIGIKKDILNTKEMEKIKILINENKIKLENEIIFNNNYLLSDEIALFILS